MDILYYSNYCKHSERVLQTLVKGNLSDRISFICIDKRSKDQRTNQQYIHLENGSKVIMPPNLHSVPSLILVNENYRVIQGDEIIKYYHPLILKNNDRATSYQGEPNGYSIMSSNGGSNILSEQYTLYTMTPEELSAKGISRNRNLFNYVSTNEDLIIIDTPDESYKPDKVSNDLTVDSLQQRRMDEINEIMPRKQKPLFG
jgi:hypothetical protein